MFFALSITFPQLIYSKYLTMACFPVITKYVVTNKANFYKEIINSNDTYVMTKKNAHGYLTFALYYTVY